MLLPGWRVPDTATKPVGENSPGEVVTAVAVGTAGDDLGAADALGSGVGVSNAALAGAPVAISTVRARNAIAVARAVLRCARSGVLAVLRDARRGESGESDCTVIPFSWLPERESNLSPARCAMVTAAGWDAGR
ncbi:hypothetical protein GCM10027057_21220 [Marisediminicola antarctica]